MKTDGGIIRTLRRQLLPFVVRQLGGDRSGHGVSHALRVLGNTAALLHEEGGNPRIAVAAALLHDCADHKLFADTELQMRKITEFLLSQEFTQEECDAVGYIVRNISFSKGGGPLATVEARIVCDADRLDAIGAVGIIRTIEYGAAAGRPFYNGSDPADPDTTLSHFYGKLLLLKDLMHTPTARKMAERRHRFLEMFLDEFFHETDLTAE